MEFKKRTKKSNATRKRTRHVDDNESIESDDVTVHTIEDFLQDQRLRTQLGRREPTKKVVTNKGETLSETQYGLHDPKKDGAAGQKLLNLLDGQFTGQTGYAQRDQHQELMNQYIEDRLKKPKLNPQPESVVCEIRNEDDLYDDLKHKVPSSLVPNDDAVDGGGVMIWNTGIAEVELPSEFHERTVRDTERALARDNSTVKRSVYSSALPSNFSADFHRHRTEFLTDLKNLSNDEQRERGFSTVNKNQPSDDAAVSRFRKQESMRRHY